MKKLIIILALILIAIYAGLSILGSGGEYAAEKIFHGAMKKAYKIAANPDVAPPAQLASVERELKLLLKKYPNANITKFGHIALLEFYVNNKKYNEAMDAAEDISRKYSSDAGMLSTSQFSRGLIYEKQNRWNEALEKYKILEEKYPTTRLGIQMPLYVGRYYDSKGNDKEAREAYREAVTFYAKMESEYSGKMLGYTASVLSIQTHLSLKDYGAAGKALEYTLNKYPSFASFMQLLPLVENIYIENLNMPQKAVELYKYVQSKIKDRRILKFLEQKIKALEIKNK